MANLQVKSLDIIWKEQLVSCLSTCDDVKTGEVVSGCQAIFYSLKRSVNREIATSNLLGANQLPYFLLFFINEDIVYNHNDGGIIS
jgi:hypothetical protein